LFFDSFGLGEIIVGYPYPDLQKDPVRLGLGRIKLDVATRDHRSSAQVSDSSRFQNFPKRKMQGNIKHLAGVSVSPRRPTANPPRCRHAATNVTTVTAVAVKTHFHILAEPSSDGVQCKAITMALAKVRLSMRGRNSILFYFTV
jgi:hypothetical protein